MSILKELQSKIPANAKISEVKFEGSEIVLYTQSKDFFKNHERPVKEIVRELKKRIEVRPDLSITMDMEKTKEKIKQIIPKDAGLVEIYFEPELGKVIIEVQKPGLVIGKGGETYKKIKNETFWLPKIERAPAIKSDVVSAVRRLLHTEIDYRKKFLNRIGQDINTPLNVEDKNNEWIRLTMLGGARQVGRSSILVQTSFSNVLMDCGVDVGSDTHPYLDAPEFNLDKLNAVVISHAHLDHLGYVPYLYELGYAGPLYCTPPTRDLMVLLCLDYIDVCQKNGKEVPYTKKAVEKAVKHSIVLNYGEVSDITPDMRLTFQPSGHLLGSALVHLHIGEGLHNILYTGDFNFGPTRLFDPAFTNFQRIETMIIEATKYTDTKPSRKDSEQKLLSVIENTMKRGGKVLMPSFAVGRAQEIMAILGMLEKFDYPVYLDGMILDATAIHTAYPEYLSQYLQKNIFHYGKNPFISDIFHKVAPRERNNIIDSGEPAVIIATSGMLIGGPSVEYLKGLAHDKKNTLLFVGYQGEGTLGRRIQNGWKEIPIHSAGRTKGLKIEMEVETIDGLSAHADRRQITGYVYRLASKPERIIVNHGEKKRCLEMARDMHKSFRCETSSPRNLESIRLK